MIHVIQVSAGGAFHVQVRVACRARYNLIRKLPPVSRSKPLDQSFRHEPPDQAVDRAFAGDNVRLAFGKTPVIQLLDRESAVGVRVEIVQQNPPLFCS